MCGFVIFAFFVAAFFVHFAAVGSAQRRSFAGSTADEYTPDGSDNKPYDGRFQYTRVKYSFAFTNFGRSTYLAPWAHDYPRSDVHYPKILSELTLLRARTDGSNVFALDDPNLMEFPFAYFCEPGFWHPTDSEIAGFRAYLLKGGFVMFDDFRGADWSNLQEQMRRVLPEIDFVKLDGTHPIFHSFFEIPDPLVLDPPYGGLPPSYYGLFERNEPSGRLMAIADVNNDISEYWEFSDTGFVPVDESNEAYKFGVNYAMYALTH